jgi:hypothetical protein
VLRPRSAKQQRFSPRCYNDRMTWSARAAVAILLALAFATVPVLLDQCAASCEHARAAASPSEPTCHHASVPAAHVGDQPIRCGHDHQATVTTLRGSAVPTLRGVAPVVAVGAAQTGDVTVVTNRVTAWASPPRDPLSRQLSTSLRI